MDQQGIFTTLSNWLEHKDALVREGVLKNITAEGKRKENEPELFDRLEKVFMWNLSFSGGYQFFDFKEVIFTGYRNKISHINSTVSDCWPNRALLRISRKLFDYTILSFELVYTSYTSSENSPWRSNIDKSQEQNFTYRCNSLRLLTKQGFTLDK